MDAGEDFSRIKLEDLQETDYLRNIITEAAEVDISWLLVPSSNSNNGCYNSHDATHWNALQLYFEIKDYIY